METRYRRIFFWFLVALFPITAGFIIFYSFGYRYSFDRGIFIYTGSINIKANPGVVSIKINGEPADSRTSLVNDSYHIGGLRPGSYQIEVGAPGFRPWTKEATVSSGLTTEFWNILLAREEYPATTYPLSRSVKVFPAPREDILAALIEQDGEIIVNILDTDTQEVEQVFSVQGYAFSLEARENIEWSPQSNVFSIPLWKNDKLTYFIVDRETKEATHIKDILPADLTPHSLRWDSSQRDTLLYLSHTTLYRDRLGDLEPAEKLTERVGSYDVSGSRVYYFSVRSGIVSSFSMNTPENQTQITSTSPDALENDRYATLVYDETRIALINYETGHLYLFNIGRNATAFTQLSEHAHGAQFSDDGKKLLFWTDWEIFTAFTRPWEIQPVREEGSVLDIGRFSQNIRHVQWSKDYEHVIFSVGPDIKVIELDHRGERNLFTLATLSSSPAQILSRFSENKLFYIEKENASTPSTLSSLDFPETTGFFGFGQ